MSIVKLRKELINMGLSKESISVCIKLLTVSGHFFKGSDGIIDLGIFKEQLGTVIPVRTPDGIDLYGKDNNGLIDIFISIKEPINLKSKTSNPIDEGNTTIAIFNPDGSIISTSAYPRRFYLFSPEIEYYSKKKVVDYCICNKTTLVFGLICDDSISPDEITSLKCQRIGYEKPFKKTEKKPVYSKREYVKVR